MTDSELEEFRALIFSLNNLNQIYFKGTIDTNSIETIKDLLSISGFIDDSRVEKCIVATFSEEELNLLLYSPAFVYEEKEGKHIQTFTYEGIVSRMKKRLNDERGLSAATYDMQFFTSGKCPICNGTRLNAKAREVQLSNGLKIQDLVNMEFYDLYNTLESIHGTVEDHIIPSILKDIKCLIDVGVGYLTLNRSASTLSGG